MCGLINCHLLNSFHMQKAIYSVLVSFANWWAVTFLVEISVFDDLAALFETEEETR